MNMRKSTAIIGIFLFCFSLWIPPLSAATDKTNEITIVMPAKVVARLTNGMLPMEITGRKGFSGTIRIKSIDRLRLGINKASFTATLGGENITYTGKIGSLSTNVNLGTFDISFNGEAAMRYDKEKHILYVQPKLMDKGNNNELLRPLLSALMHEKEYPVEIQKLKPIITEFSNKTVTIHMDISTMYTVNNRLFIGIRPTLEKSRK
jgi:hypothetical protein